MKTCLNGSNQTFQTMKYLQREDKQWNGIKNGELLKLLLENSFNTLLTFDKNLQHQ